MASTVLRSVESSVSIGGRLSCGLDGTTGMSYGSKKVRIFDGCCVLIVVISPDWPMACFTVGF